MDNYLDFGTDSESDDDMQCNALDSDEEEARDNDRLFKILMEPKTQSKKERDVDDFEMEMEAELDKRAMEIESRGGLEHQKSLSRSSSTSSLNKKSPCPSPKLNRRPSIICTAGPSSSSSPIHQKKSVRFVSTDSSSDTNTTSTSIQDPIIPKPPKQTKIQIEEGGGETTNETEETQKTKPKSFYNDIYFDSDDSEGEDEQSVKKKKTKKLIISNDELFYDPESDARDQAWVDKKRRKYWEKHSSTSQNSNSTINDIDPPPSSSSSLPPSFPIIKPLPNSDAVLNCPACFTVLCLDCQQHALYQGQYRAMFVMNCNIVKDETVKVPVKEAKKFKRSNRGEKRLQNTKTIEDNDPSNPAHLPENDSFNPVKCKVCRTQIAVYDTDEVYHFFNVLASAP